MTLKTFDPTKPVQTRDGRPARIICTNMKGGAETIVSLVTGQRGKETPYTHYTDGRYLDSGTDSDDLVNVPDAHEAVIAWLRDRKNSPYMEAVEAFHRLNKKITGIKFIRSVIPASVTGYEAPEGVTTGCGLLAAKEAYEAVTAGIPAGRVMQSTVRPFGW